MKKPSDNRGDNLSSVGEAIERMLKSYNLSTALDEKRLIESWEKLMGKTIANRTTRIFIKNKVLFIELSSAPLKNELNLSKDKIKNILQKEFENVVIEEIIII